MKVNNKGMTLIEVVVSLLILSTASLIMVMGFTTAINMFSDANSYKDAVNNLQTILEKDDTNNTSVSSNEKSNKYVITETETSPSIEVKGTLNKVTSKSETDVSLSSFKIGNVDDTRKAYKVYNNYIDMIGQIARYLEINDYTFNATATMNTPEVINAINKWAKDEKGLNIQIGNIINDLPKLYRAIYPDVEVETVANKIESENQSFDKSKNHYIVPCLYLNKYTEYTRFFAQEAYKSVVLTVADINDECSPEEIYAIYNLESVKDINDTDEWYISKSAVIAENIKKAIMVDVNANNKIPLQELYSKINENSSNWVLFKTSKE